LEVELRPVAVRARLAGGSGEASVEGRWGRLGVGEPPEVGGREDLPSPLDLLAASLASCEAFMARMIASKLGVALEEVEVEVEARFELGRGLTEAKIKYKLKGAPRGEAEKIVELVKTYCPIYTTLAKSGAKLEEELTTG
jgi:putative redox protein